MSTPTALLLFFILSRPGVLVHKAPDGSFDAALCWVTPLGVVRGQWVKVAP